MWQVISNIASVLSIISAIVTLCSALAIKSYYNKITTLYSVEKLTVAEQKSIEAKKIFQGLKEMYMTPRGRKSTAYSEKYMQIDNASDDIVHLLPVDCSDASKQVKQAKDVLNKAASKECIENTSEYFTELGICLDALCESLKSQKAKTQEKNVKNIKST